MNGEAFRCVNHPPHQLARHLANLWLGISLDEIQRAKQSTHDWLRIEHPLTDARLSRADCLEWMRRREYPKPPRSACLSCPLRSRLEWVDMRPLEFASAVHFDKAIRFATDMDRPCYVHRSCVPLDEVALSDPHQGQGDLWAGCDSGWSGT